MSETWYDEKEDVLGMHLKNRRSWRSLEVGRNVVIDLSREGEIVGIEILAAKQFFKKDAPLLVSKASGKKH